MNFPLILFIIFLRETSLSAQRAVDKDQDLKSACAVGKNNQDQKSTCIGKNEISKHLRKLKDQPLSAQHSQNTNPQSVSAQNFQNTAGVNLQKVFQKSICTDQLAKNK